MRSRKKMETTRIRKANAVVKEKEILYFAQDRDVSTRMLAILSVSKTKSGVMKEIKGADGKVQQILCPEITRYKVICGSNGKVGTRFNTVAYVIVCRKDIHRIINETLTWSETNQRISFWNNVYNMAEDIE
ncbi:hypothetical protein [uncultured phage cr50_1]|uniref:Uncharacterized protein n=1 Tax=uncultured phage cr50_1 TaxID=2772059 RepID=A0A7M1RUQ6_9CAUD|nr:hypothetical protein KNV26_gp091 [uncultured phage cr50_1]QOR58026.1 hypothetical protein [uncultured phage cr50_1]